MPSTARGLGGRSKLKHRTRSRAKAQEFGGKKYLILGDGIRSSPATNYTRAELCAVNPTGPANLFISQMSQNR